MTGHEGDEPDPLLVRPFLLPDSGTAEDPPSTQTWPAATREVRSHRVLVGAPLSGLTGRPQPAAPPAYPRRFLIVTATGVAVLAALTAAGYAALGSGDRPPSTAGPQRPPLPAVTGPQTSAPPVSAPSSTAAPQPPQAALSPSARATHPSATATTTSAAAVTSAPTGPSASAGPTASAGVTASPTTGGGDKTTIDPVPPAGIAPDDDVDRTGVIGAQNNLCLDLNGGVAVDDNHVQVFDCNGSDAQRWTLAADGTLRVVGKCALVVGDRTVHIVTCDGRTTAQWRVTGRALVNAATAQCLTDPAAGTRSGAGVTVTPCTGSPAQSWALP